MRLYALLVVLLFLVALCVQLWRAHRRRKLNRLKLSAIEALTDELLDFDHHLRYFVGFAGGVYAPDGSYVGQLQVENDTTFVDFVDSEYRLPPGSVFSPDNQWRP